MLRFEYPPFDYRVPVTPHLGSVYFPSFNATINAVTQNADHSSDSEQSSFDEFSPNSFNNDDNNNIIMNDNNNNNDINNDNNNDNNDDNNSNNNDNPSSLLPDLSAVDSVPPPSVEFYSNTPLFSPKTVNASNVDYMPPPTTNTVNQIVAPPTVSDDLAAFIGEEGGSGSTDSMISEINDFPLLPPAASLPPLSIAPNQSVADGSETDDEESAPRKKSKIANGAPKKISANRRGRKPSALKIAAATAASVAPLSMISGTTIATAVSAPPAIASHDKRKTSTGSDDDNDYSDSPNSCNPSSSDHYRTKHSISETRRRTRLRNQFKYLAEAAASAKTDRYSVLCAAIVKIEAAKRRIAELETALTAATVGPSMGLSPTPSSSPTPSAAMCCAESAEYCVCSQFSGVATALLSGDGVGSFLSANHRWLSLIGVNSLAELQSIGPSFLKVVGVSNAETASARSTLSAVSAHKHGSMTLPLDSNTILAYKNHSDSSIEPALLYANIRHFPTKSSRPALFTLSSYEHGAADNRNPCVLVTAVPCEPLPEGVNISSYNHRLAHRGRKAAGMDASSSSSSSNNGMIISSTGGNKKEAKKRSYNQRASSSSSHIDGGEGEESSRGLNAFVSLRNQLNHESEF